MNETTIRVPASSANLGPGFDVLGLALALHNTICFAELESGFRLEISGEGAYQLPRDQSNLVYRAAQIVFEKVGYKPSGLHIVLHNRIPIGSGLGSSSATIVGGMMAANFLAGQPLSCQQLLELATDLEGHPDNVAPALYGGLTVSLKDGRSVLVERVEVPALRVVVVLPHFALLTSESRAALPSMVPRSDAVFNIGRTALLIRALQSANYDLLAAAMQDRIHQPFRLPLIPGFDSAMAAALKAGAASVALSGSGPSLIAFAAEQHAQIAQAARAAFSVAGLPARSWILDVATSGAQLIQQPTVSSVNA